VTAAGFALVVSAINHLLFALYLFLRWYFKARAVAGLTPGERRELE